MGVLRGAEKILGVARKIMGATFTTLGWQVCLCIRFVKALNGVIPLPLSG